MTKRFILLGVCVAAILLSVMGYLHWQQRIKTAQKPFVSSEVLSTLPSKDASGIDTSHLASGLIPPTNKWFSGLALQKVPKTVFPTPLSFTPGETSFSIFLPEVATTKNAILNKPTAKVTAQIEGATHFQVTRYDELSVDLTYSSSSRQLGTVTLVAGSPYVYLYALSEVVVNVETEGETTTTASGTTTTTVANGATSTLAAFDGAQLSHASNQTTARLVKNSFVTFYSLPASAGKDSLMSAAGNRVTSASVAYQKIDKNYQTSIELLTHNGKLTHYGLLPHQANDAEKQMTYDTIYGPQRLIHEKQISFSTPEIQMTDSLDVSKLTEAEKALLIETLRREINATHIRAEDTYFGGKELYRSAQLLNLAKQLHEEAIASTIQQKLRAALAQWLTINGARSQKFFYYDTKIHGVVGEAASFGSQEFNDHHFHYGYFIYAASILAKYDSDFLVRYKPIVNLLVADIANYRSGELLPLRRVFDPYFGHSWASGSAPFNDGNNQESSSEAINAWVATGLWAQHTHDTELATEAAWMLSSEAAAAAAYWLNFKANDAPYNKAYNHSLVALNWGGKRDYATFFSAAPNAMLGILLIPMNPTMSYLAPPSERIAKHVDEAIEGNNHQVQFGDYILMYESLQKKQDYLAMAQLLPDEFIDNANSRSYMYAWIMSLRSR